MRLSTIVLPVIAATGFLYDKPYWYAPIAVLAMIEVYAPTHGWVTSNRLGSRAGLSMTIKLFLALFGLAGTLGIYACMGLAVWWFI